MPAAETLLRAASNIFSFLSLACLAVGFTFAFAVPVDAETKTVATLNTASTGGGTFSMFYCPFININGDVAFGCTLAGGTVDGKTALYFSQGSTNTLSLLALDGASVPVSAGGGTYNITFIFNGSYQTWPRDGGAYGMPSPFALNDQGKVMLMANVGVNTWDYRLLQYSVSQGTIALISTGDYVPDVQGLTTANTNNDGHISSSCWYPHQPIPSVSVNPSGQAVTGWVRDSTSSGIYSMADTDSSAHCIVTSGDLAPASIGGSYGGFYDGAAINDSGTVAFRTFVNGTRAIMISNGTATGNPGRLGRCVAFDGQGAPVTGSTGTLDYLNFNSNGDPRPPAINSSGQVAFMSKIITENSYSGGNGIFLYTPPTEFQPNGLSSIARTGEVVPCRTGYTYTGFYARLGDNGLAGFPALNDLGEVAFPADLTGETECLSMMLRDASGVMHEVATTSSYGEGMGLFGPALNNKGQLAFLETGRYELGSWGTDAVDVICLADAWETIDLVKSTVYDRLYMDPGLNMGGQTALNDYGQVAYLRGDTVDPQNVTEMSVEVATPEIHWRHDPDGVWHSGNWMDSQYWTVGIQPAAVHPVFIDPAESVTITLSGATNAVTIKSLSVSATGSNVAQLNISDGASLTVSGTAGVTIALGGRIDLSDGTFEPSELAVYGGEFNYTSTAGTLHVGSNNLTISGGTVALLADTGAEESHRLNITSSDNSTIIIGATQQLASLSINGTTQTTVSAGGSVTLTTGQLNIAGDATLAKTGTGAMTISGAQNHGNGANLVVQAGGVNMGTNPGSDAARNLNVTLNNASTMVFNSVVTNLKSLTLNGTSTAAIASGGNKVLVVGTDPTSTLNFAGGDGAPTALLEINNNAAIIRNNGTGTSTMQQIQNLIISAQGSFNGETYDYNGPGITSSAVAADQTHYGIGVVDNAFDYLDLEYGPGFITDIKGVPVALNDVALRFTYLGDMDLGGSTNKDDYDLFKHFYGLYSQPGHGGLTAANIGWQTGDFNLDGAINKDDYDLFKAGYGWSASHSALSGGDVTALEPIPEPTTLVLLAAGGLLALARKRRRSV